MEIKIPFTQMTTEELFVTLVSPISNTSSEEELDNALKEAEATARSAMLAPNSENIRLAEEAIAKARALGATDEQLATALKELELAKQAAEQVVERKAKIKASKKTVKKGKKTTIKITSDSGAKLTVTPKNKKAKTAKKKKTITIKNGKTAKITFKKTAVKGKYTFKVTSAAKGAYKKTTKTITIRVK